MLTAYHPIPQQRKTILEQKIWSFGEAKPEKLNLPCYLITSLAIRAKPPCAV